MPETAPHYPFNADPALQATQELSRTRLDQLVELSQELHATIPEYEGMTAFGSTVRGEARPDSDLDVFMFIRPDASSPRQNYRGSSDFDPSSSLLHSEKLPETVVYDPSVAMNYKWPLSEKMRREGRLDMDIEVVPISREIVMDSTKKLLATAEAYDADPDHSSRGVARNIRALFQAPIDSEKLQPYISNVLNELGSSKHGETGWQLIRRTVVHFEKGRHQEGYEGVAHRYIPATLEEAQGYYQKPQNEQWDHVYGMAEQFGYASDEKVRADKVAHLNAKEVMDTAMTLHTHLAPENSHQPIEKTMHVQSPDGSNRRELMQPEERQAFMEHAVDLIHKLAEQRTGATDKQFLERASNVIALSLVLAHTFEDGNGRTARTFAHLVREGYDGGEEIRSDLKIAGTNRPEKGFRILSFLPTGKGNELSPKELLDVAAAIDVPLENMAHYKSLSSEAFTSPYA